MPRPVQPLVSCVVWLAVAGLVVGCSPRARHGAKCGATDECAWGLSCVENTCHRADDGSALGLSTIMARLPVRKGAPSKDRVAPQALVELLIKVDGPVVVDLFESSPLPTNATLRDGREIEPAAAATAMRDQLLLLRLAVPSLTVNEPRSVNTIIAERLGFQAIQSSEGVPIVVGAQLRAGDQQQIISFLSKPGEAAYALGHAFWSLDNAQRDGIYLGFACVAGAYCPDAPELPRAARDGDWPEAVQAALDRIQQPFEMYRQELSQDLAGMGLHAVAIRPDAPVPEGVSVVVLAAPQETLEDDVLAWISDLGRGGTGLVALAPGSRHKVTTMELVSVGGEEGALLSMWGVQREHALLVDRAALLPYRVPGARNGASSNLPLAVEISNVDVLHPAVAGLVGQLLPLTGSFGVPKTSPGTVLAYSRAAATPALLPSDATEAAIGEAAPPQPGKGGRAIIVTREGDAGRQVVIGSDLGVVSMSAAHLLRKLDLPSRASRSSQADLVGDLGPYQRAADAYYKASTVNRALRRGALRVLRSTATWVAETERVRSLRAQP